MNLLFFLLFGLFMFACVLIGGKRFRSTTLYALAIGGAVNANFFHAGTYPIDIFGLTFGIDSIIYSLFIFCILVMFFRQGKGQAYLLSVSSLIAIIISALFQLIANFLSKGYFPGIWRNFVDFAISSVSTLIVVIIMLEVLDKVKHKIKNEYVLLVLGMAFAALLNTPLYYTFYSIIHQVKGNIPQLVSTSFLGKLVCIGFGCLSLLGINTWDKYTEKRQQKKDSVE